MKYRDLLAASRSAKSRYFATTKLSFDLRVFFLLNNLLVDLSFWRNSDRKKEKGVVSFTNDPNIIFSQTHLDNIVHEQTIIWRAAICRSRGGLSANEKEEKSATNDN